MSGCKSNRKEHVVQTFQMKINALHALKSGVSKKDVAKQFNVHIRTVHKWQKNEKKILENADEKISRKLKRKSKLKFDIIDELTWLWFNESRNAGIPINGPQICMQAQAMYIALGGTENEFKASNGWLHKFKRRHNIRSMIVSGEKHSSNVDAAEKFITSFENLVREENLCEDQIFNCDETGLNYKNMPRRTLASKSETSISGLKQVKERITIMACSNASGGLKLPLVVIGRSAKPRCIKNLSALPVYYRNQKSAWMVARLFKEWFDLEFVPKVTSYLTAMRLPIKAVLLVDNCSSHLQLENGDIKVIFLPPNTTALIQPMDQGVLQCLKLKYRFTMMRHVITCVNNEENLTDVISKINLRNAIEWIADAWDNVEPITIIKSWNPLWPRDKRDTPARQNSNKESLIDSEDGALPQLFHDILKHTESEYAPISYHSVQEWLNPPSLITPEEALSNEEVLQVIIEKEDHGKMESKNINLNEERIITGTDVINYLEKILTYSLSHPNHFSNEDVDALRRINKSIMQETERRAIESSTEKF